MIVNLTKKKSKIAIRKFKFSKEHMENEEKKDEVIKQIMK